MRGRDVGAGCSSFAPPQRLPRRRRTQGFDHIELGAGTQIAANRARRDGRACWISAARRLCLASARATAPMTGAQRRQHIGWKRGLDRGENDFIESPIDFGIVLRQPCPPRRIPMWRLRRLLRLFRFSLRKHQRARRQHQPRGQRDIVLFDGVMPESAALAQATRIASSGARSETMPRPPAAVHIASICSRIRLEDGSRSRAASDILAIDFEFVGCRESASRSGRHGMPADRAKPPARTRRRALRPARSRRTGPASATKARHARRSSHAHPSRR